jgi:hypothetical protein
VVRSESGWWRAGGAIVGHLIRALGPSCRRVSWMIWSSSMLQPKLERLAFFICPLVPSTMIVLHCAPWNRCWAKSTDTKYLPNSLEVGTDYYHRHQSQHSYQCSSSIHSVQQSSPSSSLFQRTKFLGHHQLLYVRSHRGCSTRETWIVMHHIIKLLMKHNILLGYMYERDISIEYAISRPLHHSP